MTTPDQQQLLKLQRMEMALVRARMACPQVLAEADFAALRYALGCARLYRFVPGAALHRARGAEVAVDSALLVSLRETVLRSLGPTLLKEEDYRARLEGCGPVVRTLHSAVASVRSELLGRDQFSELELDAEVGRRALVVAMGGGGGAGYVYIGAAARLRQAGLSSDYLVGASIGSLVGAVLARSREQPVEATLAWAKSLSVRQIFSRPRVGAAYTLPGLMRLHLRALHQLLQHPDGSPLRLEDLEIPYEAVVAGVRSRVYSMIPESLLGALEPARRGRFSHRLAERMLQLTILLNPMIVKPLVLGRDTDTRQLRVADAVGLSCAIPTVLQYEPLEREPVSDGLLAALRERESVALFADGGVVQNVPARIAWEGVHSGRIGTRNAFLLALDCFEPQWGTRHLWLGPLQQLIEAQLVTQRPYFDWLVRFTPTLSPVNLLPDAADFDRAWKWGWEQADVMLSFLQQALKPVAWRDTGG
ncbi:MAG TPA: patatin-like phospholipase family protein [Nevskiaceae bacterium]|nr:patatin-like phospholipase family protein [Nevskiaceae bacterium]